MGFNSAPASPLSPQSGGSHNNKEKLTPEQEKKLQEISDNVLREENAITRDLSDKDTRG